MKNILFLLLVILFTSCKTTEYIEIPRIEKEYIVTNEYDSVYLDRWHTLYQKGDTIWLKDSIVDYKYKYIHDTIKSVDSFSYTVEKIKEVNKLTPFQHKEITGFWILLSLILVVISFKIYKKSKIKL